MAITARAVYFYDASYHLTKQGSLTYDSGTGKYTFVDEEATINQGDVGTKQIAIALPAGTFSGGAPLVTFMSPKGRPTTLLPMSTASWTIIEDTVETSYQVFYYTLDLIGLTYYAGRNALYVGYLTNSTYENLDLAFYLVQDGINNYELVEADTYEEIYTAVSAVFADQAARMTEAEADIVALEEQDADFIDGTTTVKKAEQDASGNVITTTYATKAEDELKIPLTYIDTDGTLEANSDVKIASQKAVKTYTDTKVSLLVKSIVRTGTDLITITYQNDTTATVITLAELKAFIGSATTSLAGLMTAQQVTDLNTLVALLGTDADSVVNTITEILAIFDQYPEGVDLVTALAAKVDKTTTVNGHALDADVVVVAGDIDMTDTRDIETVILANEDRLDIVEPLVEQAQQDILNNEHRIDVIEDVLELLDYKEYGVREIVGQSSPTLERVSRFGGELKIGSATGLVASVGVDDEVVYNSFDYIPIFQRTRETHLDGNVFVRVPKYYIKEEWKTESGTNYHYIWMCQSKLAGYRTPLSFTNEDGTENDSYFIGAYEGSFSVDSKLKSVTNAIQKVSYSRANFRTAARLNDGLGTASKYQITDVAEYVDLVQIPMMIEFATKNMQSILQGFTAGQYTATHLPLVAETAVNRVILTNAQAALYRVGQMIDIGTSQGGRQVAQDRKIVSITVDTPAAGQSEIIFDGAAITTTLTQMVYNVANKTGECDAVVASSGAKTANDGKYSCIWRGMENPYGNTYKNIDGVKISNNQTWICLLPSLYNDTASVAGDYASPFVKLSYVNINSDGYCSELGYDALYPFAKFPTSITGGSSVLYFSDYYYQNTGDRTAFVGGGWSFGSLAGPFFWALYGSLGIAFLSVGARLSKRP